MKSIKLWLENLMKNKNHIFIVPTKSGFKFLFINFLLFIIALSFTNNMALIITFIMISYFVIQMLETHRIIQNTKFYELQIQDQFTNSQNFLVCNYQGYSSHLVAIDIHLKNNSQHFKIQTKYKNTSLSNTHMYYFNYANKILSRGFYHVEKVKISTIGMSSLFYVWCYKNVDVDFYLYPPPKIDPKIHILKELNRSIIGDHEFEEHKKYMIGEDSQRIDWKLFARRDLLYKKEYILKDNECVELYYDKIPGGIEERLEILSFYIRFLYFANRKWKLILPNMILDKSEGLKHYKRSLEAISVF